ncbi:MAG: isocitrate lyase/phosphoenolpyruvate mutase family protein, partial [Pseudomonadota bacterium]
CNAWSVGTAKLLAGLGAQALGTSSGAFAQALGRADGQVSRDEALAHAGEIVAATPLPVSGDLENGFGPDPDDVVETVKGAAEVGLAGCSIEDTTAPRSPAFARDHAIERVRAGIAAARALPRDFVFVARADGVLAGAYDLAEACARVSAYAEAGADCVFVPLPGDEAALKQVIAAASGTPVNVIAMGPLAALGRAQLAALGVARISLGTALSNVAYRAMIDAATAMLQDGRFDSHPQIGAPKLAALMDPKTD